MKGRRRWCVSAGLLAGWLLVGGCGSPKRVEAERRLMGADSVSVKRLDSLLMVRLWRLDGASVMFGEELSLSVPDTNGRQHITQIRRTATGNRYLLERQDSLRVQRLREQTHVRQTDLTERTAITPVRMNTGDWWRRVLLFCVGLLLAYSLWKQLFRR